MQSRIGTLLRTVASLPVALVWISQAAAHPGRQDRETRIRAGRAGTIVATRRQTTVSDARASRATRASVYPRPRLVGFSPLVAVTTSDEGRPLGGDYEFDHDLQSSYVGSALNPYVARHFVIGYLDSGADGDLAAGTSADTLGLFGSNLGPYSHPIGGIGGEIDAYVTMPVGFFAAGLSAIDSNGMLDYTALVGHSNVAGLAAPVIECGGVEVVTAVIGTPFMAFYNTFISVDLPRRVTVDGVTYTSPDVRIEVPDEFDPLPPSAHMIPIEFGSWLSPFASTANYYPYPLDLNGPPYFPTLLSPGPGMVPSGGAFFTTIHVREGEAGSDNPVQPMRVLVDTGAQSSIMSSATAASLSLPLEPDFTVDVCGVGGLVEDVAGYYVDYVKINAWGGALKFSQAPFVVLDLVGPEGNVLEGILGMNFFWNRNVIFGPKLDGSSFLHVSEPIAFAYGDFDVDLDVDVDDAETFVSCLSGADILTSSPECDHIDGDEDGDVDLLDFARFQLCFNDSDVAADPNCGH